MTRLLLIAFVMVALFGGIFLYLQFFQNKPLKEPTTTQQKSPSPKPKSQDATSSAVKQIINEQSTIDDRVVALEADVKDLKKQLTDLKKPAEITATTPSTQASVFIPLGNGGGSSSFDWTTTDPIIVSIDTADYPNYKNAQLEVSLRTFQGNGTAYARLINTTDGLPITDSQVSTGSENYTWVTSNVFKLYSGKKTYKIQLKTLTGYEASVQDARLRINF